jgi:hypothetical protein
MSRRRLPLLAGAASALLLLAVLALLATHTGPLGGTGHADADPCAEGGCATLPSCARPSDDAVSQAIPCRPPLSRSRTRSRFAVETRPTIVP